MLLAICALACSRPGRIAGGSGAPAVERPSSSLIRRVLGLPEEINGLSGLSRDDAGTLFSIAERQDLLIEIPADERAPRALPIDGLPAAIELESIAWLGGTRFALGTEGDCTDNAHRIALVEVSGGRARLERFIEIPLQPWGITCDPRRGLEGLCRAGNSLIAALERPETDSDGRRYAPVAHVDLTSGQSTLYRLELTSDTGKIAALDCRRSGSAPGNAMEVMAIERHFTVSHLIGFQIPALPPKDGSAPPVTPAVLFDLYPYTGQGKRNFEGLALIAPGKIALIVDNHFGVVTGPNELLVLTLPAD